MKLPRAVRDNLNFLLAETQSQISCLKVLLETGSPSMAQRILDRDGYTYNLKMRIHDSCLETLRQMKNDFSPLPLRAAESIASDMERISAYCQECVAITTNLSTSDALSSGDMDSALSDIEKALRLIEKALDDNDTKLTLKVGEIEEKMDAFYVAQLNDHVDALKKSKKPGDILASLFIAQRIEEMSDTLLDSADAIMSAQMGHPMHIKRFQSLKSVLDELGMKKADIETIAETKSGSAISGIAAPDSDDYVAIFKDGKKAKLKEERDSVENWHDIYPGLAPQILSYKKNGKNAALLIEHLHGSTYEQILLQQNEAQLFKAQKHLCKTLLDVWNETRRKKTANACHMEQLRKRLDSVLEVHPSFDQAKVRIGRFKQLSLRDLISRAQDIENAIEAPFSVYIHGDFNLDNIIFDPESKRIRFIDLHRSCYQDYTQDVSVFMVSNYRLQHLDIQTRTKIKQSALHLYEFAKSFAAENKDKTFELRLALGLARSFITSTRFILDKGLAENMYLRAFYLLELITAQKPDDYKTFSMPVEDLLR